MCKRFVMLVLAAAFAAAASAETPLDAPFVEVMRIVSGDDGKTRFATGAIPFAEQDYAPPAPALAVSPRLAVTDVAFASLPAGYFGDWHPAPRRQYGLLLSGALEIETGDGDKRRLDAGGVFLLEDVSGQGHRTWVVGDEAALVALIPVPAAE